MPQISILRIGYPLNEQATSSIIAQYYNMLWANSNLIRIEVLLVAIIDSDQLFLQIPHLATIPAPGRSLSGCISNKSQQQQFIILNCLQSMQTPNLEAIMHLTTTFAVFGFCSTRNRRSTGLRAESLFSKFSDYNVYTSEPGKLICLERSFEAPKQTLYAVFS